MKRIQIGQDFISALEVVSRLDGIILDDRGLIVASGNHNSIVSVIEVDYIFPIFAIVDVSKFMKILTTFADPVLAFSDKQNTYVKIESPHEKSTVKFNAVDQLFIAQPPTDFEIEDPTVVSIGADVMGVFNKRANLLGCDYVKIFREDSTLHLIAMDSSRVDDAEEDAGTMVTDSSNAVISLEVDGQGGVDDFTAYIQLNNIPANLDYTLTLNSRICKWASQDDKIRHFTALRSELE